MYIMVAAGTQFVDSDFFRRYMIISKDDAILITGVYDDETRPITLGRYADMNEAKSTLTDLFCALAGGNTHYFMPDSRLFYAQEKIHDARTKRKGGS